MSVVAQAVTSLESIRLNRQDVFFLIPNYYSEFDLRSDVTLWYPVGWYLVPSQLKQFRQIFSHTHTLLALRFANWFWPVIFASCTCFLRLVMSLLSSINTHDFLRSLPGASHLVVSPRFYSRDVPFIPLIDVPTKLHLAAINSPSTSALSSSFSFFLCCRPFLLRSLPPAFHSVGWRSTIS